MLRRTGVLCSQGWNGLCRDLQFISSAGATVPTGRALSFWVTHWGELRAAVWVCVHSALDQTEMNLMRVCVCALEDRSETELLCVLLCPTQRRLQNEPGAMLTTTHTGSHTHTHAHCHIHKNMLAVSFPHSPFDSAFPVIIKVITRRESWHYADIWCSTLKY